MHPLLKIPGGKPTDPCLTRSDRAARSGPVRLTTPAILILLAYDTSINILAFYRQESLRTLHAKRRSASDAATGRIATVGRNGEFCQQRRNLAWQRSQQRDYVGHSTTLPIGTKYNMHTLPKTIDNVFFSLRHLYHRTASHAIGLNDIVLASASLKRSFCIVNMQCLAKFDQAAIRITKSFVNAFVRRSNQSGTVLVLTRDHPSAATLAALTSMTTRFAAKLSLKLTNNNR